MSGALLPEHRQLLEQMTAAHVRAHGGDAQQSLAAIRQASMVGAALGSVADRDLQASLAVVDGTLRTTDEYGRPADGMRCGRTHGAARAWFRSRVTPSWAARWP
jgi:hypothetical protein